MKPRDPENPRYQEQKLAAVRAAASVFSEKGYHGASTRDIAERLGIKQGSLIVVWGLHYNIIVQKPMLLAGGHIMTMLIRGLKG